MGEDATCCCVPDEVGVLAVLNLRAFGLADAIGLLGAPPDEDGEGANPFMVELYGF